MERSILLIVLASSLLFHSFSLSAASDLNDLCMVLEEFFPYQTCQVDFGRDPRSSNASYHELAVIIVDVTTERATTLQNYLAAMLNVEKDPTIKSVMQSCAKIYSGGFPLLKRARDAAAAQNFLGAAVLLADFESAPQACIDVSNAKGVSFEVVGEDSSDLLHLGFEATKVNVVVSSK